MKTELFIDINDLSLKVILPQSGVNSNESNHLQKAYFLWKKVWFETFKELEGCGSIYSDDFYRQNEGYALFYRGDCVGITMHSFLDLKNPIHRDLKYFKAYPENSLKEIEHRNIRHLLISNQTAVDNKYRKSITGIAFGDILIGLTVKKLLNSNFDAFVAYTNNSKKVQDICYRFGAEAILKGHFQHNVEVDIVCIERKRAHPSSIKEVNQLIDFLWMKNIVHPHIYQAVA